MGVAADQRHPFFCAQLGMMQHGRIIRAFDFSSALEKEQGHQSRIREYSFMVGMPLPIADEVCQAERVFRGRWIG